MEFCWPPKQRASTSPQEQSTLSVFDNAQKSYPDWGPDIVQMVLGYYLYHHEDSASMDWDEFLPIVDSLLVMEDRVRSV
jgi:hypothetical protein